MRRHITFLILFFAVFSWFQLGKAEVTLEEERQKEALVIACLKEVKKTCKVNNFNDVRYENLRIDYGDTELMTTVGNSPFHSYFYDDNGKLKKRVVGADWQTVPTNPEKNPEIITLSNLLRMSVVDKCLSVPSNINPKIRETCSLVPALDGTAMEINKQRARQELLNADREPAGKKAKPKLAPARAT